MADKGEDTMLERWVDDIDSSASARTFLTELVRQTRARAAGLWTCARDELTLYAFAAGDGLPEEAGIAFQEATRSVPLSRTDLGIVAAIVEGEPAIAVPRGRLKGSGGWLERFDAQSSLAIGIRTNERVLGALAVALPTVIVRGDPVDRLLRSLVERLANNPHWSRNGS